MAIEREEIKVQIRVETRVAALAWLENQYWLGRHVPFFVICWCKPIWMVHARLVQYVPPWDGQGE